MASHRKLPNILIVGTPGTGKSTTAQLVQQAVPSMRHVEVGALVKDKQLHDGWDDEYECYILDEDRVRCRAGAAAWSCLAVLRSEPPGIAPHGCARSGLCCARSDQLLPAAARPSIRFAMSWRRAWRVAG
jgi:ABC-type dipeptide/oligopeptide/nickel transport system ATPase component